MDMVLDIETAAHPDAEQWIEAGNPPGNYTKPESIAKWREEKRIELMADAALDPFAGRIVCIGFGMGRNPVSTLTAGDESEETACLSAWWRVITSGVADRFIGFRCRSFDLPYLITRSRLLGVPVPVEIDLNKYRSRNVLDLSDVLTFHGDCGKPVMRRTLQQLARRFGLPVEDQTSGKDVAAMVAAGDYEAIAAHCRSDVALTAELARRIGVTGGTAQSV